MKEEEEQRKKMESIKIKEWEEKFDKEQKLKEEQERIKDERLRQRELNKINFKDQNKGKEEEQIKEKITSRLENFNVDKTTKN